MSENAPTDVPAAPDTAAEQLEPASDDGTLFGMTEDQVAENFSPINIRNVSIKCGRCQSYQTLSAFERRGTWNVYTYECEDQVCEPSHSRTLIEVPAVLDEFANRDPNWRGGKRHAGADPAGGSEDHGD